MKKSISVSKSVFTSFEREVLLSSEICFIIPCGPAFLLLTVKPQLKGYFENFSGCRGTIILAV